MNESKNELLEEVRSIKNLLILNALMMGCQQKHLAIALGVSDATLSRMFPKGFAKDVAKASGGHAAVGGVD